MKPESRVRKMRRRGEAKHQKPSQPNAISPRRLRQRVADVERYCRSAIDYDHPCNPHEVLRILYGEAHYG